MNMKKTTALLLAIMLMSVSLFGCGGSATTPTTTDAGSNTTTAGGETTIAETTAIEGVATIDWVEYTDLITQIKSSTDFVAREALMHQAEDMLMDTGALCPIYYYNDMYMMKPGVEGFYTTVYGTKYFMNATFGDATTLRINLASEPDRLDPALNSSVDGACLAANSFSGLYMYDDKGAVVPAVAEGYTVSDDGLTYVFTLKDGLKWSDGSDLTAADFEYAWKRAANPETAADYSYMLNGIAGFADNNLQVTASEDGKTLTVVLAAPCAYFLDLAAFPAFFPVKQTSVESAEGYKDAAGAIVDAGAWATEAGFVSNGAYVLESWTHNESMTYVKNPYYYDADSVKIEKLEFMLSADDTAIYAAYQSGDLDFIDTVPADEVASLLDNPEFYIADQLGTYYVCFNVKADLYTGKTVKQAADMRKAMGLLIDRQYIIDTVAQTGQKLATSFIPAAMLDGHGGEFKTNDADYTFPVGDGYFTGDVETEEAIALLESAGFVFENGKLSDSTPIAFEYLTNTSSAHEAIAQCIQQDLAEIGIDMTIKSVEWEVFLAERKAGNYVIARNGWVADFNDPINMLEMWTPESGNNDVQLGK